MRSRPTLRSAPLIPALLLTAITAIPGSAQTSSYGPLATEEAGPVQRVGFTHASEGADPVARGGLRMDVWFGLSNIFEQDSSSTYELFIDEERLYSTATLRWGAADDVELGARFSLETTGGGVLDGLVSGFHERLGLANGNRAFYAQDQFAHTIRGKGGAMLLDVPQRTLALEDVRLFAKWRGWSSTDGSRVASLRGVVRIPVAQNRVGPRRTEFSLMAMGRRSWTRWHAHGTVGAATARSVSVFAEGMPGFSGFLDLALERNLNPGLSAVMQLGTSTPALSGFGDPELDGWPVNVVMGVTGRLRQVWGFEVTLQEDITADSPAADFTLGIGIRRSW